MKNFKRFTAAIAATLMAASLSVPMAMTASAGTISVGDPATGYTGDSSVHTYKAYQIFKGTLSDTVLSDIEWGNGVNSATAVDGKTLLESIKELTKEVESASTTPFSACESAADVADILAEENDDSALTKAFADVVAKYTTGTGTEIKSNATESVNVADGYYLIQDAEAPDPNSNASKTRFILRVAGNATINPKSAYPTVMKKVQEESLIGVAAETANFAGETNYALGDGYNDIADYDIGDSVPFKLYGTLPSNYDDYKQYFYSFNDTLGKEFTSPDVSEIKVFIDGTEVVGPAVIVEIDKQADDSSKITVKFNNLKATDSLNGVKDKEGTAVTITKNSVITVEYSATLNSNAKIGLPGQLNAVNLSYSNNPNQESGGNLDVGHTPDDGVIVFTYGIDINKVDEKNEQLAGAAFAIKNSDGKYLKTDANGKFAGLLDDQPTAVKENNIWKNDPTNGVFVSQGEDTLIKIEGLDDGTYTIEELGAPDGYNKLTSSIDVKIESVHRENLQNWSYGTDVNAAANALTTIKFYKDSSTEPFADDFSTTVETSGTKDDGKGVLTIQNKKGSTLPSTGGIGTTIFYLGGGAMVAVAGIVLITKKRMGKNAE